MEPSNAPKVVVVVNQFGNVLSTITAGTYENSPKTWSTAHGTVIMTAPPAVAPIPVTSAAVSSRPPVFTSPASKSSVTQLSVPAPAPVTTAKLAVSPEPAVTSRVPMSSISQPVNPAVETPAPSAQSKDAGTSPTTKEQGYGFSYSPYMANGDCKTQEQVHTDFNKLSNDYSLVRIYGTDCNQTATVLAAAKARNLKLFAGMFDLNNLESQVNLITAAANKDWSSFDTITVGNEMVNSGAASPAAVVAAIGKIRVLLRRAGYTGKVGTVDTLVAARANPSICDASDACMVNCHPFYDGNVVAKSAGDFLTTQIPTLRAVLSNKNQKIIISETGWPWKGDSNKDAVPSPSNQNDALSSIKSAFSSDQSSLILFSTFNDMWKTNSASQFQAEQFWGFLGDAPSG